MSFAYTRGRINGEIAETKSVEDYIDLSQYPEWNMKGEPPVSIGEALDLAQLKLADIVKNPSDVSLQLTIRSFHGHDRNNDWRPFYYYTIYCQDPGIENTRFQIFVLFDRRVIVPKILPGKESQLKNELSKLRNGREKLLGHSLPSKGDTKSVIDAKYGEGLYWSPGGKGNIDSKKEYYRRIYKLDNELRFIASYDETWCLIGAAALNPYALKGRFAVNVPPYEELIEEEKKWLRKLNELKSKYLDLE